MSLTIHEVVKKLVGEIEPVGETNTDAKRFENLTDLTELVNALLTDIDRVAENKNRQEHSMRKAGVFASEFFDKIGIVE